MNLRSLSPLQLALGASVAVHAVLLTVRFVDPESFNRMFQDTPLDPKVAADQRGHGIGVALDVYTKASLTRRAEAAEELEKSVFAA